MWNSVDRNRTCKSLCQSTTSLIFCQYQVFMSEYHGRSWMSEYEVFTSRVPGPYVKAPLYEDFKVPAGLGALAQALINKSFRVD